MTERKHRASLRSIGRVVVVIAGVAALLIACGPPPSTRVTGQNPEDPTFNSTQSETAVSVSNTGGHQIITVTYNDETDPNHKLAYTATTRKVLAGASQLGWSYSTDEGKHWTHGGPVAPPDGWAVLWGDPAITNDFYDQRNVFITNLAIPADRMPAGGIDGPVNKYIGGGCVARSVDGGINFGVPQCVTNSGHFYDGGSIVSAGSQFDRRVFAAWVDIDSGKIDIWVAPNPGGTYTMMSNPFPGMHMDSHPRLRFDRNTGSLYVAAIAGSDGRVYINQFTNTWGKPVVASLPTPFNPDIKLSDRTIRTAYQFSYDVGSSSQNGDDSIRMLYTVKDPQTGRFYVRGSYCTFDLAKCGPAFKDAPEWGTTPGNFELSGQQFNPLVRNFQGFFNLPAVWKVTYESTEDDPGGNKVSFEEGNLAVLPNGSKAFVPFDLVAPQVPCPDLRGYWGDYDELQFAGFANDSTVPRFILPHSDSNQGCPSRWQYTSKELHVSAVLFN
jgi:hypothetical protein